MASEWAVENKEERLREEDYCGDSSRGLAQKNILFPTTGLSFEQKT